MSTETDAATKHAAQNLASTDDLELVSFKPVNGATATEASPDPSAVPQVNEKHHVLTQTTMQATSHTANRKKSYPPLL